ncbi:MAG TPA: GTP cyclohydrolase II [Bryobacteraceae bacterium]|jgi:GTP cyclohydrolase II|nr:GTP cyclohydrolase II [Bryobacteraceae bacterium]
MQDPATLVLSQVAEADFPTEYGLFRIFGFEGRGPSPKSGIRVEEAVVLKMGDLSDGQPPLLRIHSQCLTGDVFHSLRCDCRAQLEIALREVSGEGRGLIIYELQEGRGIGLMNKLRAYELQDHGADTVEANEQLGFESDLRNYSLPGAILRHLKIPSVRLMSNNPDKVNALENAGIVVAERVPCIATVHESRRGYLETKREKMGHLFEEV